jgi:hypothetical protein
VLLRLLLRRGVCIDKLRTKMQQSFGQLPLQQRKFIHYGNCDLPDKAQEWVCELLDTRLWQHPFSHYVEVADGEDEHAVRVRNLLNRLTTRGLSV